MLLLGLNQRFDVDRLQNGQFYFFKSWMLITQMPILSPKCDVFYIDGLNRNWYKINLLFTRQLFRAVQYDFHLNCMLYTCGIGVVFMTYLPETAGILSPWTEVLYRVSDAAKVPCIINNSTKKVQCLRRGRDVYMPFKFVKEYFEVSLVGTF